jgi:hypothetical protein
MSEASLAFQESIKDAEELLAHFDAINKNPPPPNAEVLKRSGLIMALTAWETYVKERAGEALKVRLQPGKNSPAVEFMTKKFDEESKRLYNPTTAKTQKMFVDFLGLDVTKSWAWHGMENAKVKKRLDEIVAKRGDAAHRSRAALKKSQTGHLVLRDDLEKAIKFLKLLVEKTDKAIEGK